MSPRSARILPLLLGFGCAGGAAATSTTQQASPVEKVAATTSASPASAAAEAPAEAAPPPVGDNTKVAPRGDWKMPYVSMSPLATGGATVTIALGKLDEGVKSLALILSDADDEQGLVERECNAGKLIAEIDRVLFDAGGDDTAIQFDLVAPLVKLDRFYAILPCVRNEAGELSSTEDSHASTFSTRRQAEHSVVATPSGDVQSARIEDGHRVIGWDPARAKPVVLTATKTRQLDTSRTRLELDDGRVVQVPSERTFFVQGAKAFKQASALVFGDTLIGVNGEPITVNRSSDTGDTEWGAFLQIEGDAPYFADGLLARDPAAVPVKRTKAKKRKKAGAASTPAAEPERRTAESVVAEAKVFAPQAADITLVAAPISYDCQLDARLDFAGGESGKFRKLPAAFHSIAIAMRGHEGAPGSRTSLQCEESLVSTEISKEVFDAIPKVAGVRVRSLEISLDEAECDGGYDLAVCIRGEDKKLQRAAVGEATYGLAGASCFVAGTPIATPHGEVPIESLSAGDSVYGWDPKTGQRIITRVVRVRDRGPRTVATFSFSNGTELVTTAEHPFFVQGAGFVVASQLSTEDEFLSIDGASLALSSRGEFDRVANVYDLSVEAPHDYFAGGILVHNY